MISDFWKNHKATKTVNFQVKNIENEHQMFNQVNAYFKVLTENVELINFIRRLENKFKTFESNVVPSKEYDYQPENRLNFESIKSFSVKYLHNKKNFEFIFRVVSKVEVLNFF